MMQLADLLEANVDTLLKQWVDLVASSVAPGPRSSAELANHIPAFLRQIVAALRAPAPHLDASPVAGASSLGREHGAQRFRLGFAPAAVVREYGLLFRVVLDFAEARGAPPSLGAMRLLSELFTSAVVEATDEHARRLDQARAQDELDREALLARERLAWAEAEAERQKLHDLFMQSPVAIAILEGPEHVFTLANAAYRALVNGRDVVGKPLLEALPDVTGMGFDLLLDRVMATAEPFYGNAVEIKLEHHAEGEALVLDYVYTPKRDAEGRIDGVLMSGTDVTERVRARERAEALAAKLRESEERLRRVVEASGAGLWDLDTATGVIDADLRMIELMGLPPVAPLTLESVLVNLPVDDAERVSAAISAALAGENDGHYLMEFRTGVSTGFPLRWVESRAHVLFDAEGKAAHLAGAMIDITARKQAEAAQQHLLVEVQRSEESFRTLAESLPDTVWTADAHSRFLWMNSVLPRATGLSLTELLRDGFKDLVHPDDLAATIAAWRRAVPQGEPLDLQHRVRQADGTYRWHLVRVRPTHDSSGAVAGWIGTSTDIHEQREHQADLERRHEFEQHLVGIVSHDLRSPLAAILLGATALLEEEQSEWTTKVAQRIRSSAEWSVRMIRDLLDFTQARLGAGIRVERRPTDLFTLTRAVIDEVEATHPDRTLTLSRVGDTGGTWDADRITQVVTNLVTNAVKYSPEGTPVAVRATSHDDAVELSVHNEGAPIPPEQLGRIFEPLQRATDQIDRKTRSVGLGLYIVDAIVKAHGGRVSVVSTAESGTTFTVRLPRE